MPCAILYLADQDPASTSSLGIINYSRQLVREFSTMSHPGFRVCLVVSEANRALFCPGPLPAWMEIITLPGSSRGGGLRRLWSDHVEVLSVARKADAGLIHFPKGWLPLRKPTGLRYVATLHDAIPEYYDEHFPGQVSTLKRAYFRWALRHSLRTADSIFTVSHASREHLASICPASAPKIRVTWNGPGIAIQEGTTPRSGLLVLGSLKPHKATAETLRYIAGWNKKQQVPLPVRITGLNAWPTAWGMPPDETTFHWLGRITDEQLADEYARARTLVLLSLIEGFGLPALEAILSGATVCYRDTTSLAEIMGGAPGGWDGHHEDRFAEALDAALSMPEDTRRALAERLRTTCRWDALARDTLLEYARLLLTLPESAPPNR